MNNEDLYHYGVKGMRWGHHKSQVVVTRSKNNNDTEETPKNKIFTKRNVAIGAAVVAGTLVLIGAAKYNYNKSHGVPTAIKTMYFGSIADLDKMSTKDTILKRGTKFHRISSKSVEDHTGEGKRIFASYLKSDNHVYKEVMPKYIKSWQSKGIVDKSDGVYEHIMKAKTDIKIPSKREMADLYMKTTGYDKVDEGKYMRFMTNLNNRENSEVKKFFELAKARGYHAVIDDNDAGSYSKSPLILFDLENTIDMTKVKKLTKLSKVINLITM